MKSDKKILVRADDLTYDGSNLIIPKYWIDTLAEYMYKSTINKDNPMEVEDLVDIDTFRKFLYDVQEFRNQGN